MLDSRFHGNDKPLCRLRSTLFKNWIPAFAGMTGGSGNDKYRMQARRLRYVLVQSRKISVGFGLYPLSLAATYGVSVDFLSCRYLDVSVPCVGS